MSTSTTKRIYDDWRWKALRRAAIRAAQGQCQIKLPGCTSKATQGDHILELEEGGAPFDPNNVQAACRHCNVAKSNNRRRGVNQPFHTSRAW